MAEKISIKDWLNFFHPQPLPAWEEFPDFELYMDQLVSLGNRYLADLTDAPITSSMVNSYVKKGLLPRPIKKKYQSTHLAHLLVVSLLKYVYSLETVKKSIDFVLENQSVEEAYHTFQKLFNQTLVGIKDDQLPEVQDDAEHPRLETAETFAIRAVIYKTMSNQLLKKVEQQKN